MSRLTALMPGGDHLNIIDPPGLTVMRIAGGRYRVTAAHRVLWTWMNEFAPLTGPVTALSSTASPGTGSHGSITSHNTGTGQAKEEAVNQLQVGDLVSMTIVDVFETDNQGKLLSYCPTFDNRAIMKTHATTETLRRGGTQLLSLLGRAQKSKTAEVLYRKAKTVASVMRQKVVGGPNSNMSPQSRRLSGDSSSTDATRNHQPGLVFGSDRLSVVSSAYVADDDLERHEV